MRLAIRIQHVQHIIDMSMALNLDDNKLTCIVGKNGVGKTTLIKALRNLTQADTFLSTAAPGIFSTESSIRYEIGGDVIDFRYNSAQDTLDFRGNIPQATKDLLEVELPMPHGNRFHFYQSVSDVDNEIRKQIILGQFTIPKELIDFLISIYGPNKFESLAEIVVKGRSYYCLIRDDHKYIREDYLSSGEHFLISLYRSIRSKARLVVVDEIDLSLDAAAQVLLLRKLREFCQIYSCNVVFTTHSLAMMRTLNEGELFYMDRRNELITLEPASYSYIKTLLFGFSGWDRYILTEDVELSNLLEEIIRRHCPQVFYRYKIIFVGGGSQVTSLLKRNVTEQFLADPQHVIAILDGDQDGLRHARQDNVYFIPFPNVEQALMDRSKDANFPYNLPNAVKILTDKKQFYKAILATRSMSGAQVITYLCDHYDPQMAKLSSALNIFLSIA